MAKKIVVTSALPYANGSIHLGHMVEYIQTDIFVRFLKLIGEKAIYCCADDTHGTPIQVNAEKQGITPEELIAKYNIEHQQDFKDFLIEFDSYYSTNSAENKHYADFIFNKLKEKGLIYTKKISQLYCENCKRFLPDRYVKGKCPKCGAEDQYGDVCEKCSSALKGGELIDPKCSLCGKSPVQKETEHYFFKLSACSDKLKKWLTENKSLQPEIVNYIMNWVNEGLADWDITRDGPYFGFKIPGEENKYYYVWLDAPIGYISSTANYCKNNNEKVEDYWNSENGQIIHVIGKDIIYFHYLFWPAMLMESGFNLPSYIVVHGFLTVNGEKMSKSRGTFMTARDYLNRYDPEFLRFYYSHLLSKKMMDVNLDFKEFQNKVNNELVANLSNFCYRTLSFLNKNFNSSFGEIDETKMIEEMTEKFDLVKNAYADFNYKDAIRIIMEISSIGNKYFQDKEPWSLIKKDKEKTEKILGTCVNIAKNLSILISPILPKFSVELQKQLNLEGVEWSDLNFDTKHHKINNASILVKKLENIETEKTFPLNLKVAQIISAEPHPEAEKLVVLQIDLGTEKRQIVAGIRKHYTIEELVGRKIVVVSNLKPAKLRGKESNGMLLAASDGESVRLLEIKDSKPGDNVSFPEHVNNTQQVTIEEFEKIKMKSKDGRIVYGHLVLKAGDEEVKVSEIKDGAKVS